MKHSQGGGVHSRSYRDARVTGGDATISLLSKLLWHQAWAREENACSDTTPGPPPVFSTSCCL